jgi:tRNA threonylcarbamoyladenosine biosynthesis protein TsaB
MTILALDTSTPRGSVALWRDGGLVLDEVFTADRSHSSALFPILERARALAPKLDVIVVGLGPGSYAGVRISIAAALGLSLVDGARLIGLASVAALETDGRDYVAVGDARRETFYFSRIEDGLCVDGPRLLDRAGLELELHQHAALPVYAGAPLGEAPQAQVALPRASILARLAARERGILAEGDLEPLYLREPHITQPKKRG